MGCHRQEASRGTSPKEITHAYTHTAHVNDALQLIMHLTVLCAGVGGAAGVVPTPGRDHGQRLAHGRESLGRLYMPWLNAQRHPKVLLRRAEVGPRGLVQGRPRVTHELCGMRRRLLRAARDVGAAEGGARLVRVRVRVRVRVQG